MVSLPGANLILAPVERNMKEKTTHQITDSQFKLLKLPPVSQSLPICFEDTGFSIKSLKLTCGNCGANIPNDQAYGSVARMISSVVDLDLMGVCQCEVATPFRIRIRSDRTAEWQDVDGSWQSFTVYAPTRAGLKHALKDMFLAIMLRFS